MRTYERAIVVGASSGLGRAIAARLAASGCRVAAVARRLERLESLASEAPPGRILALRHDVRRLDDVPEAFDAACRALEGLDLVVYSAGFMPPVGPTEFDTPKDRQIVEVNFLGAVAWLNLAADRFLQTRRGAIVGIGSVAGDRGRKGQPVYNASKAALHAYLEALRNRLHGKGVTVATFKPGPMRTEMTAHLRLSRAMDPDSAARIVLSKAHVSGEHYLCLSHRLVFAVLRNTPSWIFRRLPV
ncbi:MAG: SDR family NAD(P)-dependent oxidoreductase [Fimbriimonadales bacterium]|nr:SDR family NAD(P)-dependent oxidoreductase [Fimbriimonadales bacterium]